MKILLIILYSLITTKMVAFLIFGLNPNIYHKHIKNDLERRQELWINALEWCESRGIVSAINPKDSDNTPSYYSFQFKPSTFKMFGEKYNIISKGHSEKEIMELIKNHDLQLEIVKNMINDKKVNIKKQFPNCVKNKIGLPPTK